MEYFLRQIEPGNPSPFTIELTSISYLFGRDRKCAEYQNLKKFPQIAQHHTCFVRKEDDWFVADMGSPEGTFMNYRKLEPYRLQMIEVGDHIGFGTEDINAGFVCALCVKCPTEVEIKTEIEDLESRTEELLKVTNVINGDVYNKKRKDPCESEVCVVEVVCKKIKTERVDIDLTAESTDAISENESSGKKIPCKKIKNERVDIDLSAESNDAIAKKEIADKEIKIEKETWNKELTTLNSTISENLDQYRTRKFISSQKKTTKPEFKSSFVPPRARKVKFGQNLKTISLKKQSQVDKNSFEDILRTFHLNDSTKDSKQKLNDYRTNICVKKSLPEIKPSLSSTDHQVSSFAKSDVSKDDMFLETNEIRQRIKRIQENLQSKGKLPYSPH